VVYPPFRPAENRVLADNRHDARTPSHQFTPTTPRRQAKTLPKPVGAKSLLRYLLHPISQVVELTISRRRVPLQRSGQWRYSADASDRWS